MFLHASDECHLFEGNYIRKVPRDHTLSLYIRKGLRKLVGVREDLTFDAAADYCVFLSGLMHTPRSSTEAADFIVLVATYGYTGARKVSGRWVDRSGNDVTNDFSSFWGTNQPINGPQYLCATISKGEVYDVKCSVGRPFVCDIDTSFPFPAQG